MDPNGTIIGSAIPPGYHVVHVDRVIREHWRVALNIIGGDGERTIGEAKHGFILWRLLLNYLMIGADESERNSVSIFILNY
jgi:hypothetical protein